ncbi:MAG: D-alanyl-D-alanine carboxypeptidase family protein [Thiohalorhabdus sp.]|uniref:D-alanyl-D-alanine carboxypeptidase family protein n=1 Tax=Thiohalorhabdus sp. TaxID=3094134 RepID=UPI003980DD39
MNRFIAVICLCFILLPAWANARYVPEPPGTPAEAAILMDAKSGRILASQNPDKKHPPASLAKLMTAYITFQAIEEGRISLEDEVRISKEVWELKGSQMFLKVGERVSVDKLLRGLLVQSGNDAGLALAEHLAGGKETFLRMMNRTARDLGMENSHFTDPAGLPGEDMVVTARDMAKLGRAIVNEYPQYLEIFGQRSFNHNGITQSNRNRLLGRMEGADGLKTGHTEAAGYNLVGTVERDGMRLISVVLGSPSAGQRFESMQGLLNYGFRFYETRKLYASGETVETTRVWQGAAEELKLTLAEPLYVTIPRDSASDLELRARLDSPLRAPVQEQDEVGMLQVKLGDESLARRPLLAKAEVAPGGWIRYLLDAARLQIQGLWEGQKSRFLAHDEGEGEAGEAESEAAQPG